ncbi:MAG: alpha/beta hydrolase [Spirochaetales bacterium]|nr:alpha/beta hydrolase [Spirochaetales bacterium]
MKTISVYKTEKDKTDLLSWYDRILKNWPTPFGEMNIETACGMTHIITCGNKAGKPVLLFHGHGNNSLMWRYNCGELGKRYHLFLIDTINDPGKSQASASFDPAHDYASWIKELIAKLELEKASLIGHSKGGWLALNTAIFLPEHVEKIALLAPAVGINEKLDFRFFMKSMAVGMNPSIKNVTKYFEYITGPGREINPQYVEYVSRIIKGTSKKIIKHRRFSDSELASIKRPVLLLFGEYEVCNDYKAVMARAGKVFSDIEMKVIPGTGHGLQGEDPELVNKTLADFLG